MATFETIQNEVIARLGNRTDISSRTAIWINDAIYELAHNPRYSFRELDTTFGFLLVADTNVYDIAVDINVDDLWFILALRLYPSGGGATSVLRQVHIETIDERDGNTAARGKPTEFAIFGSQLFLDPIPDAAHAMEMRYRKRLATISAGQTFPLGREWEEPATVLAVAKGLEALQRFEEAALYRNQVLEPLMTTRLSHLELEEPQYETTIGVAFDRWS